MTQIANWIRRNWIAAAVLAGVAMGANWAVHRYRKPGQLDVIAAQAMDMSQMHPPTGVALVDLASVRAGSLDAAVTYTGSVVAFNEQDISPRVTGRLIALPVYPGDRVTAGEVVAQLDTEELQARADAADAETRAAQLTEQEALLTHHLHHRAALDQAQAQLEADQQSVDDARAQEEAARDGIGEAQAAVESAQATSGYWATEVVREKQLVDAGAASQQEYQNEVAQAQAADAAVTQAKAHVLEAQSTLRSAVAKVAVAGKEANVAQSGKDMAEADLALSATQHEEEIATEQAAAADAREASVELGYTTITAPDSGVVTERPVAPGTLVQVGTVILKIAEIDRVRIQANVAVDDIAGIGEGSPVAIDFGDGRTITTRVTSVFPSADPATRTAVVEAVVDNPGHRLLPGAFVSMRLSTSNGKNADNATLLVPSEAVVTSAGQSYIWVARGAASANAAPLMYRAVICGQIYSAADAKKYHYRCPMDHGKLVPIPAAAPATADSELTAHRVTVNTMASDGTSTEVTSDDLQPNDLLVRHGQASLSEGDRVARAVWGSGGPEALPTQAELADGDTTYKCVTCGMVFSAADAARDHYKDPMDGGALVPVTNSGEAN